MRNKFRGISRIISNAEALSNPVIADCFFYECEDPEGFGSIVEEIDDLRDCLPEGVRLLDLPHIYCGNKKTKVFGLATCDATCGHRFLEEDSTNRVVFKDMEEAKKLGYRPCKRCMKKEYLDWEKSNKE